MGFITVQKYTHSLNFKTIHLLHIAWFENKKAIGANVFLQYNMLLEYYENSLPARYGGWYFLIQNKNI